MASIFSEVKVNMENRWLCLSGNKIIRKDFGKYPYTCWYQIEYRIFVPYHVLTLWFMLWVFPIYFLAHKKKSIRSIFSRNIIDKVEVAGGQKSELQRQFDHT